MISGLAHYQGLMGFAQNVMLKSICIKVLILYFIYLSFYNYTAHNKQVFLVITRPGNLSRSCTPPGPSQMLKGVVGSSPEITRIVVSCSL